MSSNLNIREKMLRRMTVLIVAFFSFSFLIYCADVNSVKSAGLIDDTSVSIDTIPLLPGPFQKTTLRLKSFAFDTNRAYIVWLVDGVEKLSGIGKTSFSFTTKNIGETTSVRVIIQSDISGNIVKSIAFTPVEIDMLWSAVDSYVPPFYKGKALPSSQSVMRVVAIPYTKSGRSSGAEPESFIYRWQRNYSYAPFHNKSGYGSYVVDFARDLLRNTEIIEVDVSSLSGTVGSEGSLFLEDYDPELIFYEYKPLEGVLYDHAIAGDAVMKNGEISLIAEPFYFSSPARGSSFIDMKWAIGAEDITDDDNESGIITLRTDGVSAGSWDISVYVESASKILQSARKRLTVSQE